MTSPGQCYHPACFVNYKAPVTPGSVIVIGYVQKKTWPLFDFNQLAITRFVLCCPNLLVKMPVIVVENVYWCLLASVKQAPVSDWFIRCGGGLQPFA